MNPGAKGQVDSVRMCKSSCATTTTTIIIIIILL